MGIGLVLLNLVACHALDVLGDPKMSDLQLTVDVLNVSLKDTQHAMAELRAEVELRNQELAETQVSRAQLEGRVRESEHRLREARHVISLQREELAESRVDRERITQSGAALQGQLKQLRKQLSRIEKQAPEGVAPMIMGRPVEKLPGSVPVNMKRVVSFGDRRGLSQSNEATTDATLVDHGVVPADPVMPTPHSQVLIKYGDTLWSLAQRYQISVHHLMAVNALSSDYIQAGQSLWLPESAAEGSAYEQR